MCRVSERDSSSALIIHMPSLHHMRGLCGLGTCETCTGKYSLGDPLELASKAAALPTVGRDRLPLLAVEFSAGDEIGVDRGTGDKGSVS